MRRFGLYLLGFAVMLAAGSLAQAAMDDDTDNKFTIHGEVRFRGESWNNLVDFTDTDQGPGFFGDSTNDSADIWPYRVRLAAKGDLGNDIWVYGEFQAAGVMGGGLFGEMDPIFGDDTEFLASGVSLYQGYVKLKDLGDGDRALDLTIGRQEIVFDRGLHFSSLDFYNGISHDGVMAQWASKTSKLNAFWFRPFESNLFAGVPSPGDADDNVLGVHWGRMVGDGEKQDVAAYGYYQMQNDFAIDPGQDRGKIYTLGARWGRMMKGETGWLWNLEGSWQFGDVQPCALPFDPIGAGCFDNALDLSASVLEGAFGYNWHEGKTDQKVWGGLFYATGNDDLDETDPNDIEVTAFQPLYTDFHSRLGYADLIAPTNVMALSVGYKINVDDRHIFGAQFYDFRKAEEDDSNTTPLYWGQITPNIFDCEFASLVSGESIECEEEIAQELDLTYSYAISNNFSFDTALAYVIPGDAIEQHWSFFGLGGDPAGPDPEDDWGGDNAWRLYGQARARF